MEDYSDEPMDVWDAPSIHHDTFAENKDEVEVTLSVKWSEGIPPQKRKVALQRALTVWANKSGFGADLYVLKMLEDGRAVIKITPAPGVTKLQKLCDKPLTTKDGKTVTIVSVSLTSLEPGTQMPEDVKMSAVSTAEEEICLIPVCHFWYLNQIYKGEIERIKEENGVEVTAEVKVTCKAAQEDGDPKKASSEFTNLAQKCIGESNGSVYPLKFIDPEDLKDALRVIQRPENKVLFTLSSEEMTICGPRKSQDAVSKFLNAAQKATNTYTSTGESTWPERPKQNIGMSIKDPLISAGLTMEETHWKLMTTSFGDRIAKIKDKFGVDFKESGISQGKVEVKARYKGSGGNASMESHAVRALLHLYQKIVTSPMSLTQRHGAIEFNNSPKNLTNLTIVSLTPSEPETEIPDDASLDLPPSFASAPQHVKGQLSEQSNDMTACNIPMHHYWYANQAYKEEIKRIEEESGVKIMAEVKLTFEADQRNGDPNYAFSEFINLVQKCSAESRGFTVPLKKVNPEELKDALNIIQRSKNKLLLTLSAEEMTVCGPRQSQDAIRKSLNATQKAVNTDTSAGESTRPSQNTPLNTGTSIRDPIVNATMEESSRKLKATSIDKFGVDFKRLGISRGKVDDRADYKRSGRIQYQKTATSPMSLIQHHGATGSPWFCGSPKNSSNVYPSNRYPSEGASSGHVLNRQSGYSTHNTEAPSGKGATAADDEDEECPLCRDTFTNKKQLKCKHEFCEECLAQSEKALGPTCPVCKDVFGKIEGDQPDGEMTWKSYFTPLPGFPGCGHIIISYHIPGGKQTEKHPNPGKHYSSISRTAYLPDNKEGREVLFLLKKAFDQKLIFTVGTSRMTGLDDQVTWNDIHHKTSMSGGPLRFGYPDPDYLSRVKDELKAKGIK